jgi:deferrochelatase/peroxidase EfeB
MHLRPLVTVGHHCGRGDDVGDGSDDLGRPGAGLFFMCYQRDSRRQFVPVKRQLSRTGVMNEYIRHVSGGLLACPPTRPTTSGVATS